VLRSARINFERGEPLCATPLLTYLWQREPILLLAVLPQDAATGRKLSILLKALLVSEERHDIIPGRAVLRVSLTPLCNLRCRHCHNEGQAKPWLHKSRKAAAISELDSLIRAAVARGVRTVRFTGGDPGMYPYFFDLVAAICSWRSAFPSIDKWALTTNGIPFLNQRKFTTLASSTLTHIAVGIDSVEAGELSRPSSPVGVPGDEVFEKFVVPLSREFRGGIKINVVFTGDENRTLNVVRRARSLRLDVTVLEVNGVMGERYNTRAAFERLRDRITEEFPLTSRLNEDLKEVYLYDALGREVIKFYPDHCARRECDVCRKLDFRVIQSTEGLAAVPCYEQAQSKSIPLMRDGVVSDVRFGDAIKYNGRGPLWFANGLYDQS
jgi:molybdenum cofactor biosynthesis enzyme MoaA